jgi:hypothetical protein
VQDEMMMPTMLAKLEVMWIFSFIKDTKHTDIIAAT